MHFGKNTALYRLSLPVLNLASLLFKTASLANLWIKARRRRHFPEHFIISVESLSFGGTGKTPLVIAIGQALEKRTIPFAIISRGYRSGFEKSGTRVDGSQGPDAIGDEPWLLKRYFPDRDIFIGRDRLRSLAAARETRVIIMDDGLQTSQVKKDLRVMLLNPKHPYFYLRHFKIMARGADLVLTYLPQEDGGGPVAPGTYCFRDAGFADGENRRVDVGRARIVAFSALGDNDRFRADMGRYRLAAFRGFPDHHVFQARDIRALDALRREQQADWLVCTEKDFGKVQRHRDAGIPLIFYRNRIELPDHAMEQIVEDAAAKGVL
jgi:tetraacyldisaccharide 4'-kinase